MQKYIATIYNPDGSVIENVKAEKEKNGWKIGGDTIEAWAGCRVTITPIGHEENWYYELKGCYLIKKYF